MEEIFLNLKKSGWNLSFEKVKEGLSEESSQKCFLKDPEGWLINQDLNDIGAPSLPDGICSGKITQLSAPVVLQVKSIEIISAPQRNVDSSCAPRMLKVNLTDGKVNCIGIEYSSLKNLSLKTLPGTKVRLINSLKLSNGFLLLDQKNIQVLGGEVADLVEEWKIQQLLIGHVRAALLDGGPPPWVPFGRKVQQIKIDDTQKEEPAVDKEKEEKDVEFLNQRQDAIAAAAAGAAPKKIFRGSSRQIEIQQTERRGRGRGGRGRDRDSSRDDYSASNRPRDSIRLFEFLGPQIGTDDTKNESEFEDQGLSSRDTFQDREPREGSYRGRGKYHHERERRGYHQDSGVYTDGARDQPQRSFQNNRGSQHEDRRGGRGRGNQHRDSTFRDHRGSYQDRRGSHQRGFGNETNLFSRNTIETLVDDFNVWPGLEDNNPPLEAKKEEIDPYVRESWALDDYCLAKWESTNQSFPAVIQQLLPNRKSVTVMFIETGAIRIVETKHLSRDPQDIRNDVPSNRGRVDARGTRISSSRSRGRW